MNFTKILKVFFYSCLSRAMDRHTWPDIHLQFKNKVYSFKLSAARAGEVVASTEDFGRFPEPRCQPTAPVPGHRGQQTPLTSEALHTHGAQAHMKTKYSFTNIFKFFKKIKDYPLLIHSLEAFKV